MSDTVIKLDNVSKSYKIHERGFRSFREEFTNLVKRISQSAKRKANAAMPALWNATSPVESAYSNGEPIPPGHSAQSATHSPQNDDLLWALKNVSFEVNKGEALGIIGANGSGKTTILRLLAKVTSPTKGSVNVCGKVAPMIQVGAGFHPELTGRENVYLNASIMGLNKKEVDEKYDDIVSFAEVEGFMDTPVKRYSSGMYVRLGFAVVANINTDIFLIDEILSVGDLSFQRKCLDMMAKIRKSDKCIVFVSHNLSAVKGLCDRVIWLDKGEIKKEGDVNDVINAYTSYMTSKSEFVHDISYVGSKTRWGTGEIRFTDVRVTNDKDKQRNSFPVGEQICIEATYESYQVIDTPVFWIGILNSEETWVTGFVLNEENVNGKIRLQGKGSIKCSFESEHLYPGSYYVVVAVFDRFKNLAFDRLGNAAEFELIDDRYNCQDYREPHWKGAINLPHRWEYKFKT